MDGIHKTALFLSGLEWKTVDLLLGRLDPESAKAVRREMMSLGKISETESHRLANEFLEASGVQRPSGSVAECRSTNLPSGCYGPPSPKTTSEKLRFPAESFEPRSRKPFDFLADVDPEIIRHKISSEHPQTISVILANIPKSRAAKLLGLFPISLRNDVSRRLADYEPVDDYLVTEIAATLRNRLENSRFDFDDVERLDNAALSRLFHSVDIETAVLALVGAKASLIERIVKRFTPTEEHEFRRQLKRLGTIDEQDVRSARRAILSQLTR